jgi:hypothetical protein
MIFGDAYIYEIMKGGEQYIRPSSWQILSILKRPSNRHAMFAFVCAFSPAFQTLFITFVSPVSSFFACASKHINLREGHTF